MKKPMKLTILILFLSATTFAQSIDFDSLKSHSPKDTLFQSAKRRLDSIQTKFYHSSDSLKSTYQFKLAKLDSAKSHIQAKLISVISLTEPTRKYQHAMDSVNQLREKTRVSMNEKLQSIKDQTTKKLEALKAA